MIINTLMFRLQGTSTKSRALWRNKKGSKRKLYMGYVCSDTFWALNTKICFKKGECAALSYVEDLLIQTLIFLSPAGFSLN